MNTVTDEYMHSMLAKSKQYSIVILKDGPNVNSSNARQVIWEHGRRNMELKLQGQISIICPVRVESRIDGIIIFNTDKVETECLMDQDPGVQAGIFIYEVHPAISFPGDKLT